MNELALFAGAGGGILGGILCGFHCICAVEKESYCREVLFRRQRDGLLPMFPIWDDITTFDGKPWHGTVDIVTAGFPCQPWSVAGKREGEADERNLWPDTIRVIREVGPEWVLLENVPGLLGTHGYFGRVLGDLAESGFDARWDCIPASAIGANHQRDRLWIVAHSTSKGLHKGRKYQARQVARYYWWDTEPPLGRVADGLPHRVDRLKALGNGQVPGVVRYVWEKLRLQGPYWAPD